MADYGVGRTGGSLRDALNELYPMLGMGEYNAMFPPQTGAPQPSGPVPVPRARPPMPVPLPQARPAVAPQYAPVQYAPPAGAPIGGIAPSMAARLAALAGY